MGAGHFSLNFYNAGQYFITREIVNYRAILNRPVRKIQYSPGGGTHGGRGDGRSDVRLKPLAPRTLSIRLRLEGSLQ